MLSTKFPLLALCLLSVLSVAGVDEKPLKREPQKMQARDANLKSRFKELKVGMKASDVRARMGVEPTVLREDLWAFKLSSASDTATERNITLLVGFKTGKVAETQITYTCLYVSPRD